MLEKEIKGYEGLYSVTDDGRIWSHVSNKWLKPVMRFGYCYISLVKDKAKTQQAIHRIVAEAFCDNPECKPYVNHIDGNKSNNNVDNLEWVTPSENSQHAWNIGLCKVSNKLREVARVHCKNVGIKNRIFSDSEVRYIRRMYKDFDFSQRAIAKQFDTSGNVINLIVNHKTYSEVA